MKKRFKVVAVVLSLLCVLQIGTVASSAAIPTGNIYFRFTVKSVENGYTYGVAGRKDVGIPYSRVTQDQNSLGTTVPTNYIIIASDGQQISDNVIVTDYYTHFLRYYSAMHEGRVFLRANSGSTLVGYNVSGTWEPNDYGYACGCY